MRLNSFPTIADLYGNNSSQSFWKLLEPLSPAEWERSYITVWRQIFGDSAASLADILHSTLGEGRENWQLGPLHRAYYHLKPLLPRTAIAQLRRWYRQRQETAFSWNWPVEDRYARLHFQAAADVLTRLGIDRVPCLGFWPRNHRFAFVLTHDVETARGRDFVRTIADLETDYGFRSAFYFIPERYRVDEDLLAELKQRGFEVGVHGLKHDGKLFASPTIFQQRLGAIAKYLQQWDAVGFRSPLTHRHPQWMQALPIEYDASFFDTDPYEPMPGGTGSLWPFFIGRLVELPYTLVQDYTLFEVLKERSPRLWLEKVEAIERYNGMALLDSHPDYLENPEYLQIYEAFLRKMSHHNRYWHALPQQVARWWRSRHEANSPDSLPDATVAYWQRSPTDEGWQFYIEEKYEPDRVCTHRS